MSDIDLDGWRVWSRGDLLRAGLRSRGITRLVREGTLVRARNGHYLGADAPEPLIQAVRVGGRLGCLSLLALHEVFVRDASRLHVHMERGDSRLREPAARVPLRARHAGREVVLHWQPLVVPPARGHVDIMDAVAHAVRCQPPRDAVATLDSVLHLRLLSGGEVREVLSALPARFRTLLPLVDAKAESGTETLVRLMLRSLGCDVRLQVRFDGVGRVDLVVDGWLVVECDSSRFHSDWAQRREDYRRDCALGALGLCVLRLTAEDILYRPEQVLACLRGLVASRRVG